MSHETDSDERHGGMKDDMDDFEVRLARSLRRVDAPEDLTRRLLALAVEVKEEKALPWRERKHRWTFFAPNARAWMGGAVAAALVAGALIGGGVHEHHARQQAEANQQFALAVQVTGQALEQTREQLLRAGVPLGQ